MLAIWASSTSHVATNLVWFSHFKGGKRERLISSYARKWLGLPRCLSRIGLYSNGIVELSISGLSREYKRANVRLEMMLTESNDPSVAQAAPTLATGMKWTRARCSSTGTSWGGYSNRGVVLAFGPAHQPGARLVRLRDAGLWCRRYVSRRRQQGLRRPSLRQDKVNGWDGRAWRRERSPGKRCGRWGHSERASPSRQEKNPK